MDYNLITNELIYDGLFQGFRIVFDIALPLFCQ